MTRRTSFVTALAAVSGVALLTLTSAPEPEPAPAEPPPPRAAALEWGTTDAVLAALAEEMRLEEQGEQRVQEPSPGSDPGFQVPSGGLGPYGATGWTDGAPTPPPASRVDSVDFHRPTLVSGLAPAGTVQAAGGGRGKGSTADFAVAAVDESTRPLDPKTLRRAIKRQMPKLRACYERALKGDDRLQGRMTLAWKVRTDGGVEDVRIRQDDMQEPRLRKCVVTSVAGWRFPQGTEDIGVEYPLVLSTRRDG